jgi:hypothetical protein
MCRVDSGNNPWNRCCFGQKLPDSLDFKVTNTWERENAFGNNLMSVELNPTWFKLNYQVISCGIDQF